MRKLDYDTEPPTPRKYFGLTWFEWLVVVGVVFLLLSIVIPSLQPGRHGSGADQIEKARKRGLIPPATKENK